MALYAIASSRHDAVVHHEVTWATLDLAEYSKTEEASPASQPRRTRLGPVLAAATAFLVAMLSAGAFVAGRATAPPAELEQASEEAAVPAEPSAIAEPIAAVAAALAPSVVQLETGLGLGSGVIYDQDGLILTAAHVVEGADAVTVVLSDGTRLEGTVVGADPGSDIAVVRVDRTNLPAAPLALGTELQVGQTAIAIGSPFGLRGSVTAGVISAVAEAVPGPDGRVRTMIQTDAPINPGNSGGALAGLDGMVIGVNDAIFSLSGGNEGIGFAVPIDTAVSVADRLVSGEPIRTAQLGITGTDPDQGRAGALVTSVLAGSAADSAGIEVGDLIVSFDGVDVQGIGDLAGQIHAADPGEEATLVVVRFGEEISLTLTLGEAT